MALVVVALMGTEALPMEGEAHVAMLQETGDPAGAAAAAEIKTEANEVRNAPRAADCAPSRHTSSSLHSETSSTPSLTSSRYSREQAKKIAVVAKAKAATAKSVTKQGETLFCIHSSGMLTLIAVSQPRRRTRRRSP
jgi:hypothetical protein